MLKVDSFKAEQNTQADFDKLQALYADKCAEAKDLDEELLILGRAMRSLMLATGITTFEVNPLQLIENSGRILTRSFNNETQCCKYTLTNE